MKNLFLCLILLTHGLVHSQQYVPLPLQNCIWQLVDQTSIYNQSAVPPSSISTLTTTLYPSNSIIINQLPYVTILNSSGTSTCFIRQDTVNRIIYARFNNDTTDKVLYNFNYIKGDSVKTYLGEFNGPGVHIVRIVDSVFYQSYNDGICRKTFRLIPRSDPSGRSFNQYIIEGIGNNTGLLNIFSYRGYIGPGYSNTESWNSSLTINNYQISPTITNSCYNTVSTTELDIKQNISVFPNPTTSFLNINSFQFNQQNSDYSVSDLTGRIITKGVLNKNINEIDLSTITEGIYIAKVNINNVVVNYKIVKE